MKISKSIAIDTEILNCIPEGTNLSEVVNEFLEKKFRNKEFVLNKIEEAHINLMRYKLLLEKFE